MSNESTTKWINSLSVCMIGKCRIDADSNGRIWCVIFRGKTRFGKDGEDFLKRHPRVKAGFEKWLVWRAAEINNWKHNTPHYRYDCDGGAFAVRVNGVKVKIGNGVGDGNYPFYIVRDDRIPPSFKPAGASIEGPCTLELLDYDCDGGSVLETIKIADKSFVWFSRDDAGAIAMEVIDHG